MIYGLLFFFFFHQNLRTNCRQQEQSWGQNGKKLFHTKIIYYMKLILLLFLFFPTLVQKLHDYFLSNQYRSMIYEVNRKFKKKLTAKVV